MSKFSPLGFCQRQSLKKGSGHGADGEIQEISPTNLGFRHVDVNYSTAA